MHFAKRSIWVVLLALPLFFSTAALAYETDDYVPEVTDRVARISFLGGDVKIRRGDSADWEAAVMNLPIVEGDELWTEANGRFEIQFNSGTHVRVSENSSLKIAGLKEAGIALSLPQGNLTVRTREFNPDNAYVEIDAPKTTISIRRAGMYRIDAGHPGTDVLRISATDGGEARVYTENSGFTVKNGRSAKLFLSGDAAGEWAMADSSNFSDEFDSWSLERDLIVAKRIQDAFYDKYYDRDVYGAEDLNEYGEWVHTSKYGYVWRPHRSAISVYDDWSPYRYGHWRWIPPYGWTWVNDEPWGWATYHYGRWIWDDGYWYWTPYGYYRNRRSWWSPALVMVRVIRNNICWYPLDYYSGYYDYNRGYHRRRRYGGHGGHGGNQYPPITPGNPTTTPTPIPNPGGTQVILPEVRRHGLRFPVPPTGVITVAKEQWGRTKLPGVPADQETAKVILSKVPDPGETPPILPPIEEVNKKAAPEIRTPRPASETKAQRIDTGAGKRASDAPLDTELRKTRILGNRAPVEAPTTGETGEPRKTGAVSRPPIFAPQTDDSDKTEKPQQDSPPILAPTGREGEKRVRAQQNDPPIFAPRNDEQPKQEERRRPEPTFKPEPRQERPAPRNDPPPRRDDSPKYEPPPRYDPPPRNDPPRNDPPPKSDPPPSKKDG